MSQIRSTRRSLLTKRLIPSTVASVALLGWAAEAPAAHALAASGMRTVKWICTAKPAWQWLSGSGGQSFPVDNDPIRSGTITLPPLENYWYPCITLIAQGVTTGNAYLRYFQQNGIDVVQAMTVAQGAWVAQGPIDPNVSQTNTSGGINLIAQLV